MQLKRRIKRIEMKMPKFAPDVDAPPCEHPSADFDFYRSYPASGFSDQNLVVKGHCNICGFDDFLWSHHALTEEQEGRRSELKQSSQFWAANDYDLALINQNLLCYTPWAQIEEVRAYYAQSKQQN